MNRLTLARYWALLVRRRFHADRPDTMPLTSSLGIRTPFESRELRRLRRRTACTQNQGFTALPELCGKKCSKETQLTSRNPGQTVLTTTPLSFCFGSELGKQYLAHLYGAILETAPFKEPPHLTPRGPRRGSLRFPKPSPQIRPRP